MKRVFFLFFLISIVGSNTALSQDHTDFTLKKVRTVSMDNISPLPNQKLQKHESPYPGGDSYKAYLQKVKAAVSKKYPRKNIPFEHNAKRSQTPSPIIDDTLLSTWKASPTLEFYNYGGSPSDHTLALSKDGILLIGWNTSFYGIDLNTNQSIFEQMAPRTAIPFQTFMDSLVVNDTITLESPFDPKLRYDPIADRFVMCFLSGRDTSSSKTLFAFSSSANPNDPWHVYEVPGNPLNNGKWSDYPQFSLTKDELFYTVNLIDWKPPGQSDWRTDFNETVIWQMDKAAGFAGADSIDMRLWHNLDYQGAPIRYSHPVKNATEPEGPNCYFVSNRSKPEAVDSPLVFNDTVFVLEVTNTLKSGNAQLNVSVGTASAPFITPPEAQQSNGYTFQTNDGRILGAIIDNGNIHFVGNGFDTASGRTAAYHGIVSNLQNGTFDCDLHTISAEYDLGYPNIAYAGIAANEEAFIIGFNHTDTNKFAGQSAVFFSDGEHSEVIETVPGFSNVEWPNSTSVRWGDYYGIQRDYADPGMVYGVGYKGVGNSQHTAGIVKMRSPYYIVASDEELLDEANKQPRVKVFPNPIVERFSMDISIAEPGKYYIEVFDTKGSKVVRLLDRHLEQGEYTFSFSNEAFKNGVYIVSLQHADGPDKKTVFTKILGER